MRYVHSFLAAMSLIGFAVVPARAANILSNPGFEGGPGALFPGGVNILVSTNAIAPYTSGYTTGAWGGENVNAIPTSPLASVPPPTPQVINPNSGKYMLDMIGAGTGSYTQAWQLVDVTSYAPAINAGGVTTDFSAFFNGPSFANSTGLINQPLAEVTLQFYDSAYLNANQQLNVPGVPVAASNAQLINPLTWTNVGVSNVPVPVGTSYILAQVLFNNASLTDPATSTNYDGYVDDASLTLNSVPEPASTGLLIISGIATLSRRRRRTA